MSDSIMSGSINEFKQGKSPLIMPQDESTPFCPWSDDFLLGIDRLDKQHDALFSTLNKLHDILMSHGSPVAIDKTLSCLIDQTRVHFQTEETFMQQHDYPDYEGHKTLHDILLRQIEGVLETQHELESYHLQQSWAEKLDLADFLREWLLSHIVDADKKLGDFLKKHGG
ncbi:MAG: bacteriohemerythrin [Mariprofundaceae bacterium]|nr:bacteriohemerythrin [Mariprofundaceae bacterium]